MTNFLSLVYVLFAIDFITFAEDFCSIFTILVFFRISTIFNDELFVDDMRLLSFELKIM